MATALAQSRPNNRTFRSTSKISRSTFLSGAGGLALGKNRQATYRTPSGPCWKCPFLSSPPSSFAFARRKLSMSEGNPGCGSTQLGAVRSVDRKVHADGEDPEQGRPGTREDRDGLRGGGCAISAQAGSIPCRSTCAHR